MAHQLDGAFLRIGRAQEHLDNLKTRTSAFVESERHAFGVQFHAEDPEDLSKLKLVVPETPPPDIWGVLTGEIVYNLRVALDYLVYALAEKDSGQPKSGTQFPIEDTPDGFAGRQKTFLNGVNAVHVVAIERLQPYKGCQWTGVLKRLSNVDKHRHLVRLKGQLAVQLAISIGSTGLLDALPNPLGAVAVHSAYSPLSGETVYVQHHALIRIGFDDGTPVMETLETLKLHVAQTLEAFKPEF